MLWSTEGIESAVECMDECRRMRQREMDRKIFTRRLTVRGIMVASPTTEEDKRQRSIRIHDAWYRHFGR
jgi:hypothetical protein